MFFTIGALKSFANFTRKLLCWSFFLIKKETATLLKTDSSRCFPIKFVNFVEHLFYRTAPVAVFENNEQQHFSEGFARSCYKIVSPIFPQELTNDFAVWKHCIGTLLASSHGFWNKNYRFQKEITLYVTLYEVHIF